MQRFFSCGRAICGDERALACGGRERGSAGQFAGMSDFLRYGGRERGTGYGGGQATSWAPYPNRSAGPRIFRCESPAGCVHEDA